MKSKVRTVIWAVIGAAVLCISPTAAQAATIDPAESGTSVVDVSYAPECVELVESGAEGITKEDCKITTETTTGETFSVSAETVNSDPGLSAQQRAEILDEMSVAAITGRHFSQFTNGAAYSRTHNGTFYFNGSRVWVTQPYAGYTGSHSCFTDYSVGLTIVGTECSDSGGTTWRTLRDRWTVGWGTDLAYSVTMACTVYTDGSIAGPGATTG